jgi:hypothetical protein
VRDRDSSVGRVTGWTVGMRFPAGARNCSLLHSVETDSGAHPAAYPMGTRVSFPGREADHSPPFSAEVKNG